MEHRVITNYELRPSTKAQGKNDEWASDFLEGFMEFDMKMVRGFWHGAWSMEHGALKVAANQLIR